MTEGRPRSWQRSARLASLAAALVAHLSAAAPASTEATLGSGAVRIVGAAFDVEPVAQAVPVGVPAVLRVLFGSDPSRLAQSGLRVFAELAGPGLASPVTLSAEPGADLRIPPLQVKGEYRVEAIRLTDGGGTAVPAAHRVATITVTDVLVASVTSRVLTPGELADRGVVVDDRNFRAFSFSLGLAIQGQTIGIELPALVWDGAEYQAVGPPRIDLQKLPERFQPPSIVAVPLRDEAAAPPPFEREAFEESEVTPQPVFGLLVFPGNVRFLNQFLSVVLLVQNGSPAGTGLLLKDVATRVTLPVTGLRLAGTTPVVADGQPIPVRHPGPDGVLGTPDDLVVLLAQQGGSAEFVAEGLKAGTHEVVCEIEATLDGLVAQPPRRLTGRARGSVVIRDPSFALTFHHPEVVRKDEEYELRVTVANTSTVRANQVGLSIDAGSLSGAVPVDVAPGVDPAAALGDVLPGEAADARFRLRATRTGRVVASAFSSDGSVAGSLRLRTGVTNDGTPLSPDMFVFPPFVSALPAQFVDAATRLIGIAHGLATADPSIPGSLSPPGFSDGSVRARATELVSAARRARLGEPAPSAVVDVFLRWLGIRDEVPAFDLVRRTVSRGRELEAAAGASLELALRADGRAGLDRILLDAVAANAAAVEAGVVSGGPMIVLLEADDPSDPSARLRLSDPKTGATAAGGPMEAGALREIPYAALIPLAAPGGGQAALVGRLSPAGLELAVEGRRTGTAVLDVLYPDGRGGVLRARFTGIPVRNGSLTTTRVASGAAYLVLSSSLDGPKVVSPTSASPSPFAALAAVQDVDANPLGKVVTLLFNREVDEDRATDPRLYRLPTTARSGAALERAVERVAASSDPRLVSLLSGAVISPVRPGSARGEGVPGGAGERWSGDLPIAVRLAVEGGEVEGRVLGPDGAPLPNATVRLSEPATDDLSGRSFAATTATVRTDARGAFTFDFVRRQDGKPFRIDALDPASGSAGWAAGSIRRDGDVVHVDVALLGRGTVRGVVVDGTGARVPRAIVRCSSSVEAYRSSQYSGMDGSFVFPSVPVGTLQLQAEETRTRETTWATARLDAPGASNEVTLVLAARPRSRLSGRVVRGVSSIVADAWVAGYGETGEYFGARKTPADGTFFFESAPAGGIRLEVFDAGASGAALVQPLTLLPDGVADVTLVLPEATSRFGTVVGVVRRTLGAVTSPVAGAPVWATNGGVRTTSGVDGAYRLESVPVGPTSVTAILPSSGRSASAAAAVLEGGTSIADLLFPDTSRGSIRGSVVDPLGRPRADALVEIWDEGPPLKLVAAARSGSDGAFVLENVPPGTWRVQATSVEARGAGAVRDAGSTTATLPGPGTTATATIGLRGFVDVNGRVVARVRDRNGSLVESPVFCTVEVHAGNFSGALEGDPASGGDPETGRVFSDGPGFAGSVKTDAATGEFRFPFVHGGPIRLVAKNPFYGERAVDLGFVKGDATRGPVVVVFEGNLGIVDGFLIDASGSPVASARVTLTPLETRFGDTLQATTAGDGSFLFPLVPFGPADRVVFSGAISGVDRWAEARVRVSAEAPRARATLRVLDVGDVTVHVVRNGTGALSPVAGASVHLEETEGPRRSFDGTTDADGLARFSGVAAVRLAVAARKDLVAGRSTALGTGEGFRLDAVVSLAETASVEGTVRWPSTAAGAAGVNVLLDAGPVKGVLGAATTDAEGRFRIDSIPGGDGSPYRLRAQDPRTLRGGSSAAFLLAAGEIREIEVRLRAIGGVTGVVRTFDGTRSLAGAEVDVQSVDEEGNASPSLRVSTGEDGRYRADGVPEGAVLVTARVPASGLSARAAGRLAGEGAVLQLDLAATATGRLRGSVLTGGGAPLPSGVPAPEVRLEAGVTRETRLSPSYDFAEVDATAPFVLRALERVDPFHAGLTRGRVAEGRTTAVDVRYAPFGTLRVRSAKPDPDRHGLFLPAPGTVVLSCGEPYAGRFPCGMPMRTDAAGTVNVPSLGIGAIGGVDVVEDLTKATGRSAVTPFGADGETRDVTVVVESRGLVRGRLVSQPAAAPVAAASVVVEQKDIRGDWATVALTLSGADGRFEIRDLPFGVLAFRAATTAGPLARAEVALDLTTASPALDLGDVLLDAERPRVVSFSPADGSAGVGLLPVLEAQFSEPLGTSLLGRKPGDFVELSGPYGRVPVDVVSLAGGTALRVTVQGGIPLAGATAYELRLLGSLPDRSGMTLGADAVVRFSTADLTAPTVLTSAPLPREIQVATDVNPVVVFTRVIDAATLTAGVRLERLDAPAGPANCAPALRADGRTVALNPAQPLEVEAEYQVVVDGVADIAGNRLPSPVRIPFLTRDDRAPVLTLDAPATLTPLEGSRSSFTIRFDADDVARVRLTLLAATGASTCGEVEPDRVARSVSVACVLPRIATAGGATIVVRADGDDRSGNSSQPSDRTLTLAPDAPPVLLVTSPVSGRRLLSGTAMTVLGSVTEDNGAVTVSAKFGGVTRVAAGPGAFALTFPVPIVATPASMPLEVSAVDAAGNPARPVTLALGVDPDVTFPSLSITSPEAGGRFLGGRPLRLVASASDDASGVALRWRAGSGAWSAFVGDALSVTVPTPVVASETAWDLELEARDGAGNVTAATRTVRLLPNLPPSVVVVSPGPGFRVTAQGSFVVEGTADDDGGVPTVTAKYGGTARTATATAFSFSFPAPAVSTPTETSILVTATDTDGNSSTPISVPVTVVPDAGGTPTIVLTSPTPMMLLAIPGLSIGLTYADNVGLESATAEVTGGLTSGGRLGYTLVGTSAEKSVPLLPAAVPFGTPARVVATLRNVSARGATLDVTLPIAFHRLESPLPAGPIAEGSLLSARFRLTPEGRARAMALRLEVGTRNATGFTSLACAQRAAPLAEIEALAVAVPSGRTDLVVRSVLVAADGSEAPAADVEGLSPFERALPTTADSVPPTVAITAPAATGSFASGNPVEVTVKASDDVRLRSVEVTFAGITKACLGSPCQVSFFAPSVPAVSNLPIAATARDASGRSATVSVSITVAPPGAAPPAAGLQGDGRGPRVTFVTPAISPAPVAPLSVYVPWVDAADEDGIEKVEVFLGEGASEPCFVLRMPEEGWPPRKGCAIPELPEGTELPLVARATDRTGEMSEARALLVVRPGLRVEGPKTLADPDGELAGERLYVEGAVVVAGDLRIGELHLRAGATLSPSRAGQTPDAVRITAGGDVVLDAGSRIDASGVGQRRVSELDAASGPDAEGAGAPHGGDAGSGYAVRRAYGSPSAPDLPGARGGVEGTFGGGVVALSAKRIAVAGVVTADGEDGNPERPSWRGLGAGGSIFLIADETIFGPVDPVGRRWGVLSARGGAPSGVERAPLPSALAAGGRIALQAPRLTLPALDVSGSRPQDAGVQGHPGTTFVRDVLRPGGALLEPTALQAPSGTPGGRAP